MKSPCLKQKDKLICSFQADSQRISDGWGLSVSCWQTERNCFNSSQMCFCFFLKFSFCTTYPYPSRPLSPLKKKTHSTNKKTPVKLHFQALVELWFIYFFLRSLCWGYVCFSQQSRLTFSRFVFGLSLARQSKFQCCYLVMLFLLFYFMLQLYSNSHSHAF